MDHQGLLPRSAISSDESSCCSRAFSIERAFGHPVFQNNRKRKEDVSDHKGGLYLYQRKLLKG